MICPVGEAECTHLDTLATKDAEIERLSELVSTDSLTGLYNYRHFSLAIEQELERTRRNSQSTSMAMLDIDFFKTVNDTWGHEAGNIALKQMADIMLSSIRKIDVACRYGGEEFALIFPGTYTMQAVEIAERIRKRIESTPVIFADGKFNITVSIGVATYNAGNPVSAVAFKSEVDKYLYQAKESGRNQTCHQEYREASTESEVSQDEKDLLLG